MSTSLPTLNKQWLTSQNGLSNLIQTTSPLPVPGPNEVLVKIHTISLNYRDTEVCMGLYKHHDRTMIGASEHAALVPCSDMCGTVVRLGGEEGGRWKIGDRVLSIFNQTHLKGGVKESDMKSGLGFPLEGILQRYRVFGEEGLVRCPEYLSDEEACTLPIAGVTAWMAINGMRELGKRGGVGETVLIQGTGGVSISGLQIAKGSGAEVIITSSSDEKLETAKKLGADHTINYKTHPCWDVGVLKITDGTGVDIIFEVGGAQTIRKSFNCIKFGGLIDCIGYLSGKTDDVDGDRTNVNVLALRRNVTLKGILNGGRDRFEEMLGFYEERGIRPVVDRVFGFEEAREGLEYLVKGEHFGKIVVRVD